MNRIVGTYVYILPKKRANEFEEVLFVLRLKSGTLTDIFQSGGATPLQNATLTMIGKLTMKQSKRGRKHTLFSKDVSSIQIAVQGILLKARPPRAAT